jgi:diguanylate cyclase (GGDEF)-like protein/PAS domain S-box-containing protein
LIKAWLHFWDKVSKKLFLKTDFKNHLEFEKRYTCLAIQRAKIFKWVILALSIYNFYLDFTLAQSAGVDPIYRRNLLSLHLITLGLAPAYLVLYKLLGEKEKYRFSRIVKAVLLSDLFLTIFIAAVLSLNGQRFSGNIDAYIMIVIAAALAIPLYPRWVLGLYGLNHIFFLIGLGYLCKNNTVLVKQANSTTTVVVAMVLFLIMYRYHVQSFLNEEMLQEDKRTFIKLFEINPLPLVISGFTDGKIRYANRKAMAFYGITPEQAGGLQQQALYQNVADLNVVYQMLEANGKVNDYVVEQKTLAGEVKYAIVNYELIDYFGQKCILSGVTDITEIKRIEKELQIHASTDVLTGVLNRRVGMELLKRKFEAAKQEKREFTLCFFDIDNLKAVNDAFGHLEGDAFIIDVCRVIKAEIRAHDAIFRYGGDEFIILFDQAGEEEIHKTCRRIAARLAALNQQQHKPYVLSASIGVFSHKPEMNLTLEQVIAVVDKNMYEIKRRRVGGQPMGDDE